MAEAEEFTPSSRCFSRERLHRYGLKANLIEYAREVVSPGQAQAFAVRQGRDLAAAPLTRTDFALRALACHQALGLDL